MKVHSFIHKRAMIFSHITIFGHVGAKMELIQHGGQTIYLVMHSYHTSQEYDIRHQCFKNAGERRKKLFVYIKQVMLNL